MNHDSLISRIAPVSDADAAAMISEQAVRELARQIMQTNPRQRPSVAPRWRRHGRVALLAAATAAVTATAAALAATMSAGGPLRSSHQPPNSAATTHRAPVTSPAVLAGNATVLASRTVDPRPTEWIYLKLMSTVSHAPPGGVMAQIPRSHRTTETWTRVDRRKFAFLRKGKVVMTSTSIIGSPLGWPPITYRYLNSLPASPARLMQLIRHNIQTLPALGPAATEQQIFQSVEALIENNPVLPARLSAALYGVLAQLRTVHLGHATDLAGQKVLSLYQIQDGYLKEEIFINPATYAYAGQRTIAIRAHSSTGLDSTMRVRRGELLNDQAVITSAIVERPGER